MSTRSPRPLRARAVGRAHDRRHGARATLLERRRRGPVPRPADRPRHPGRHGHCSMEDARLVPTPIPTSSWPAGAPTSTSSPSSSSATGRSPASPSTSTPTPCGPPAHRTAPLWERCRAGVGVPGTVLRHCGARLPSAPRAGVLISVILLGILASLDPLRPVVFVLVLRTRRINALAFLVGWAAALSLLFVVVFVLFGGDVTEKPGSDRQTWISVAELLVGAAPADHRRRDRWRRRAEMVAHSLAPDAVLRRLDQLGLRQAGLMGVPDPTPDADHRRRARRRPRPLGGAQPAASGSPCSPSCRRRRCSASSSTTSADRRARRAAWSPSSDASRPRARCCSRSSAPAPARTSSPAPCTASSPRSPVEEHPAQHVGERRRSLHEAAVAAGELDRGEARAAPPARSRCGTSTGDRSSAPMPITMRVGLAASAASRGRSGSWGAARGRGSGHRRRASAATAHRARAAARRAPVTVLGVEPGGGHERSERRLLAVPVERRDDVVDLGPPLVDIGRAAPAAVARGRRACAPGPGAGSPGPAR